MISFIKFCTLRIENLYNGLKHYLIDFFYLLSGNVVAQGISFLSIPILTILYEPNEYALLGIFIAICSTFSPSSTGKLEVAGVIVNDEKNAQNLFIGSFWFLVISVLVFYFVYIILVHTFNFNFEGASFGILLPYALFLSGLNLIWIGILNRKKIYRDISFGLIIKSVVTVISSILFFELNLPSGLIIGYLVGLKSFIIFLLIRHVYIF